MQKNIKHSTENNNNNNNNNIIIITYESILQYFIKEIGRKYMSIPTPICLVCLYYPLQDIWSI